MKTDNGFAIALFALVMGGAVALAIANDIAAPACKAATGSVAGKEFDFGCLEFWLSRYQTMFAAFIGAGVALYVVRPVFSQLVALNRQTAVQLETRAELRALELEGERNAVRNFQELRTKADSLLDVYNDANPHRAYGNWHKPFSEIMDLVGETARVIVAAEMRSDPEQIEAATRTAFANRLAVVQDAAWRLTYAFMENTAGNDPSESEAYSEEECREAEPYFRAAVDDAITAYGEFARQHMLAIKAAWQTRNRLASEALG